MTIPQGEYFMMGDNRDDSDRQPVLGPGAEEQHHRRGICHLLAAQASRTALVPAMSSTPPEIPEGTDGAKEKSN